MRNCSPGAGEIETGRRRKACQPTPVLSSRPMREPASKEHDGQLPRNHHKAALWSPQKQAPPGTWTHTYKPRNRTLRKLWALEDLMVSVLALL